MLTSAPWKNTYTNSHKQSSREKIEMEKSEARRLRTDLSPAERERFEKYGSIDFKSAGATRKRRRRASLPYSHDPGDPALAPPNPPTRPIARRKPNPLHTL